MQPTENALVVLEKRYFLPGENWDGLCKRVAKAVAKDPKTEEIYFKMMNDFHFLPNTPTIKNAGTDINGLSACYVIPILDSMESIFDALKAMAIVQKSGGGTGFSFSRLREKNSRVLSTNGVSSGAVSFMKVFNHATDAIKQGGVRRGACGGVLEVDHPEIFDFIMCKDDPRELTNFNISVGITDKFMDAVENNKPFDLISRYDGSVVRTVDANELFDLIAKQAHKNGEPGILFIDELNRNNNLSHIARIDACNPCFEQDLIPWLSCNLGAINVGSITTKDGVNWDELRKIAWNGTLFLNDVIDLNVYPLKEISDVSSKARKIGLGVMGIADMLAILEIPYASQEGRNICRQVMSFINETANECSIFLGERDGHYEYWNGTAIKRRNSGLTTCQPCGTVGMIADASSGIEPYFSLAYTKNVMDGESFEYVNKYLVESLDSRGLWNEKIKKEILRDGSIQNIREIPECIKKVYLTAQEITPDDHILMQSTFQSCIDSAVSKTINMPKNATVDDVKKAYLFAYKNKVKGLTVYRDGSRENQVLVSGSAKNKKECPECGSKKLIHESSCVRCDDCGWSKCELA